MSLLSLAVLVDMGDLGGGLAEVGRAAKKKKTSHASLGLGNPCLGIPLDVRTKNKKDERLKYTFQPRRDQSRVAWQGNRKRRANGISAMKRENYWTSGLNPRFAAIRTKKKRHLFVTSSQKGNAPGLLLSLESSSPLQHGF